MVKEEIVKELKDKKFWSYLIGMMLSSAIFLFINLKTVKIIALGLLAIFQFFYNIKKKEPGEEQILKWIYFVIFAFYFIIYLSLQVGELVFSLVSILMFILAVFIGMIVLNSFNLKNSKKIIPVILSYIGLSISIILLFGFLFSILGSFEHNQILDIKGEPIKNAWSYISFSAFNFYSVNYGEIPLGYSKIISFIQLLTSFIIHVIIISRVINSLDK